MKKTPQKKAKTWSLWWKWFQYGLLFIIIITLGLRFLQSSSSLTLSSTWTGTIEAIQETKQLPLSEWMANYQSWSFSKIELINDQELKGFSFIESWTQNLLFWNQVTIENYNLLTTTKPVSTSLTELGISVTGENKVLVTYKWESLLSKLIAQVGYIIIFIIILYVGMRFIMP